MSTIWREQYDENGRRLPPAFSAAQLTAGTRRFVVGPNGARRVAVDIEQILLDLAALSDIGLELLSEDALRARIVTDIRDGVTEGPGPDLLARVLDCGQEKLPAKKSLQVAAMNDIALRLAEVLESDGKELDDADAGLLHFANDSIKLLVNRARAPLLQQVMSKFHLDEAPGEGEYIVDWNEEGEPTLEIVEARLNPPAVQMSVAQKLAAIGLTPAELKAELAK